MWCQQQAPGMRLQGRGKNGLGERLYPQGDLQLAKAGGFVKMGEKICAFTGLFAAGIYLGMQYFHSFWKGV